MKFRRWLLVLLCGGLGLAMPLAANTDDPADSPSQGLVMAQALKEEFRPTPLADDAQRLDEHWEQVRTALKAGAYQEALRSLGTILRISPNDPWATLYRSLCESRLASPEAAAKISPAQLETLTDRLRLEGQAQRRTAGQQKAMDRAIGREQAKWALELERVHQEAEQAQQQKRKKARTREQEAEAQVRKREEERAAAQVRALAQAPAPTEQPAAPAAPVSEPSVQLQPVSVPTRAIEPVEGVPRRRLQPGAVEITGRQMSMSPDRKIAIAEGDVEVLYGDIRLTCDHLTLFTDTHDAYAEGHVRIEDGERLFRGEMAHYNLDTKKGRFLQGTMASPPWYQYGRWSEQIAEGVFRANPGYLTSCDHDPPHFKFASSRATVWMEQGNARAHNVLMLVDQLPVMYLPQMSFTNEQSPFFIIPGKRKPWGHYSLMGYRYELSELPGGGEHEGALRLDWRRHFGWGVGIDHQVDSPQLGKGLLKVYYNNLKNRTRRDDELPKGADEKRYRLMWRHIWQPRADTTVVTDLQEFSDIDFRKELLFREEFTQDDVIESFISTVTNRPAYSISATMRKRMNRFQTVTEQLPQVDVSFRQQRIGDTQLFSSTQLGVANLNAKRLRSDEDTDVLRLDGFQELRYALNWFRPIELTPRAGMRQTYYTKDIQGSDIHDRRHNLISGQFTTGMDASLKFFRVFPVTTNAHRLDLNLLRHVISPTVAYSYTHEPTVPNSLLSFPSAGGPSNTVTFGLENKLQTKRKRPDAAQSLRSVDLARFLVSIPYTFKGRGNKDGAELGNWSFDLELYPWPWMRFETDWSLYAVKPEGVDSRFPGFNVDLVMVGGEGAPSAAYAPNIQAPRQEVFEPGPKGGIEVLPKGQWYLGFGHRYAPNDKTEDVLQYDWQLSEKWQLGTFHRFTWKEVEGTSKRFRNVREYQYSLRRDLHDWVGELVYRVDREFGEELFLTVTLKAFPEIPFEVGESYHQPKIGSQNSPFSPVKR